MTPEQPKLSDDGKFFWDGERWAPMPDTPKKRWQDRQVASPGMVLIMLIIAGFLGFSVLSEMS